MARPARKHASQNLPTDPLSMVEIHRRFEGRSVLVHVTEVSTEHAWLGGRVLFAGTNDEAYRVFRDLLPNREPGALYTIFEARDQRPASFPEMERSLQLWADILDSERLADN